MARGQTLFPRVGERMAAWRAGARASRAEPDVAVVEVPLLFEAGIEGVFDATVAVVADEALREERAGARGHQGGRGPGRRASSPRTRRRRVPTS